MNKTALTKMWFLLVPDNNPQADGRWVQFDVRTSAAAGYRSPFAFYTKLAKQDHPNEHVAAASRVPPMREEATS
jgi:hypothetical protein